MIIEHKGKRIDTDKPIRFINDRIHELGSGESTVAHYVGKLRDGCHVVEYYTNVGRTFTYQNDGGMVQTFENVPPKRVTELFVVMWPESFAVYRDYESAKHQFDKHSLASMQRVAHEWES